MAKVINAFETVLYDGFLYYLHDRSFDKLPNNIKSAALKIDRQMKKFGLSLDGIMYKPGTEFVSLKFDIVDFAPEELGLKILRSVKDRYYSYGTVGYTCPSPKISVVMYVPYGEWLSHLVDVAALKDLGLYEEYELQFKAELERYCEWLKELVESAVVEFKKAIGE